MSLADARRRGGMVMLCLSLMCLPSAGLTLDLAFPGDPELVQSSGPVLGQHPIATAPFDGTWVPTEAMDGMVQTSTWQISGAEVSTAGIHQAISEQLSGEGYDITFACAATECGGFDFRHALPVGRAPEMHVDLGNFQYVAARIEREAGNESVALMISEGGATVFVHVTRVLPASAAADTPVVLSSRSPDPLVDASSLPQTVPNDLVERLLLLGSAPLDDLLFETGASQLSGERYPSLVALAAFLEENPARQVVLVGHTDTSGSIDGNIALSRARAEAVSQFLTNELGVDPSQVDAQGIGFLAPRASNSTPEGREANRRVEVVLTTSG